MTEIVVKRRKKGQHNQKTTPLHHLPRTELSKHIAAIKASADEFECSRNDEKEKRKKKTANQASQSITDLHLYNNNNQVCHLNLDIFYVFPSFGLVAEAVTQFK